jgi:hypothetical protein
LSSSAPAVVVVVVVVVDDGLIGTVVVVEMEGARGDDLRGGDRTPNRRRWWR